MRFLRDSLSVSTAASVASGSKLAGFDSMAIARWAPESACGYTKPDISMYVYI